MDEIWPLVKSQSLATILVLILGTLGYLHFDRKETVHQRFQKYTVVLMCIAILGINFWFAWKWQQTTKALLERTPEFKTFR